MNAAIRAASFFRRPLPGKAIFSGMAQVLDAAPVTRPVTGKIDLYSLDGGWATGSPRDVLSPVLDALFDSVPLGSSSDKPR